MLFFKTRILLFSFRKAYLKPENQVLRGRKAYLKPENQVLRGNCVIPGTFSVLWP